jgi:hypothetical protein
MRQKAVPLQYRELPEKVNKMLSLVRSGSEANRNFTRLTVNKDRAALVNAAVEGVEVHVARVEAELGLEVSYFVRPRGNW